MIQKILQAALKTSTNDRPARSRCLYGELYRSINGIDPSTTPFDPPSKPLLSSLSPALLNRILSDPHLGSSKCLAFFDYLLQNQPSLSFRPNLQSHLILACRLLKATNFSGAERLLGSVLMNRTGTGSLLFFHEMIQKILQAALKTSTNDRPARSRCLYGELYRSINGIDPSTTPFDPPSKPLLSSLSPSLLNRILSDPHLGSSKCLAFFDYLLQNQPSLSFRPNLQSHLILACRLLKATNFSGAERLLRSVLMNRNGPYPFSAIACVIEKCCVKARTRAKLLEMMLNFYSEHGLFDQASLAFDYLRKRGVQINERACTVHLLALNRSDQVGLSVDFFSKMVDSPIDISVYSLTVVVDGLCRNGAVKMARELVEQMSRKRVEPNVVTFNTLIDACVKWWNFPELDLVLLLMQKEGVEFNPETYKFLIDGYTSCGRVEEAEKLLLNMHDLGLKVDTHLYNLTISASGKVGSTISAVKLFDEMTNRGVEKNADTYWALISRLCEVGEIEQVTLYVREMRRKGIQMGEAMMERVVDAFGKRGMADEAYNFLINTEKRETES